MRLETFEKPKKTIAVYGGSFDPITRGHVDIILKAAKTFDEVIVAIGVNPKKTRMFTVPESLELIRASIREVLPWRDYNWGGPSFEHEPETFGIRIDEFTGSSLVHYAQSQNATHLVRGLRQISDFNDEFSLCGVIQHIAPDMAMTHFISDAQFLHVSSSTAKELASLGHDTRWLVGHEVEKALKEKFSH